MVNIIVCEPENFILEQIEKTLYKVALAVKIKINVKTVANSIDCISTLNKDYIQGKHYHLLFIDDKPLNMDENFCIKFIKTLMLTKKLNIFPIYATSGYSDLKYQKELKEYGCDGFVNKPISEGSFEIILKSIKL